MDHCRQLLLSPWFWCGCMIALLANAVEPSNPSPASLETRAIRPPAEFDVDTATAVKQVISKRGRTHMSISLTKSPSPASRRSLERAGIRLLSYLGEQIWLASVSHERVLRYGAADAVAKYPGLSTVRGIGLLHPKDKLSRQFEGPLGDWAYTSDGRIKLTVSGFSDADLDAVKAHLVKNGATVSGAVPALKVLSCTADASRLPALADHDDIRWIAPTPLLGPGEAYRIRRHIQVSSVQSDLGLSGDGVKVGIFEPAHAYPSHRDFSGRLMLGQGDTDNPVYGTTNAVFDEDDDAASRAAKAIAHATKTAGTIGGDGSVRLNLEDVSVELNRHGMAPEVEMYTYSFGGVSDDDSDNPNFSNYLEDLENGIVNHGIHIASNAWGTPGCQTTEFARYTGLTYWIDRIVRGALGRPVTMVFSAGNERDKSIPPLDPETDPSSDNSLCYSATWPVWTWESAAPFRNYGTINHPKAAKNAIVVGAVGAGRNDDNHMMHYSSWGPTLDGRVKPDLVASGNENGYVDHEILTFWPEDEPDPPPRQNCTTSISWTLPGGQPDTTLEPLGFCVPTYATEQDSNNNWQFNSHEHGPHGQTSAAAAAVSGGAALLIEGFHRYFPDAGDPTPAAIKALLLHTALDLNDDSSWYNRGPDYASGYGLAQIGDAVGALRRDKLREGLAVSGSSDWYKMQVPSGAISIKVTLVWDDPAPEPGGANVLVNDLELVVQDRYGDRRFPWTLNPDAPELPAFQDRADHLNNVEQVVADASDYSGVLPAGEWNVYVEGLDVSSEEQPYALVANYTLMRADLPASTVLGGSVEVPDSSSTDDLAPRTRILQRQPKRLPDTSDLGPKSLYLVDCPPGPMFFDKYCDPRVNPAHDRFLIVDLENESAEIFSKKELGLITDDGPLFAAAPLSWNDKAIFVASAPYADRQNPDVGVILFFDQSGKPVARIEGKRSGERLGLDMDVRGSEVVAVSTLRFLRISDGKAVQEMAIPGKLQPRRAVRIAFTDDVDGDEQPDVLLGTPYANAGGLEEAGLIQVIGSSSRAVIDTLYGRQRGQRLGMVLQSINQPKSSGGKQ